MAHFSNGTEGDVLDQQCVDCLIADDVACPILMVQANYNYDQLNKGNEQLREAMTMLVDEKGRCQMKLLLEGNTESQPRKV